MPLLLKRLKQLRTKSRKLRKEMKMVKSKISLIIYIIILMILGASLGPLDGSTFAVKDNLCTANTLTTCASRFLSSKLILVKNDFVFFV